MQQGLLSRKESSDSSNIFKTPGLYPQVNVRVRRKNYQQLSAFQSLFGQLNDPQHEEPNQSQIDQAVVTRSNSALENSLLVSNIKIQFDPPTPQGSKSRDDSFYSCASEFQNDHNHDIDQEQQSLDLDNTWDNEQHNENEEINEVKKNDIDHECQEQHEEDDEFKSISGDIFDQSGSVLSGKAGSSLTQFYTPKLLSLDGNFGNNEKKNNKNNENNNENHYEMRINRDTISIEEDAHDQIINANRETSIIDSKEKIISNKYSPAVDRLSQDSKTHLYRNLLESPYSPDAPQNKSRNPPTYQPPPLALSIDVKNTPRITADNNFIDTKINCIVDNNLKTRLKSMSQSYLQKNQQSNTDNLGNNNLNNNQESQNKRRGVSSATGQSQQHTKSTAQPSLFQTASLAKKKALETKKRAFQSFQTPLQQKGSKQFKTPLQSFMQTSNLDCDDDPFQLALSAPGNQKDLMYQSQQYHDASNSNSSYVSEKNKAVIRNNLHDQFSYYSRRGKDWNGKGVASMNRLIERKNEISMNTELLRNKTIQGMTLNLTLLISLILEKHPGLLYVLSLNHMIGTCARGGLYFLVIVLSGKDIEFLIAFLPLLFFSRLYYTVSMYYLLFYFEQKSVSFRQISKIFNARFSTLRTRVDRSLAAEIINDNMNNTRYHAEIIAKRFFALCPVELNFIALSQITSGRKSNLYYISNFIYQGIESILLYPPVIIYCYLKNTNAQVVGIDFLQITKYVSVLALIIFTLFCSYLLVFGNKYLKKM